MTVNQREIASGCSQKSVMVLFEFKCSFIRRVSKVEFIPRHYRPQLWSGLAIAPVAHLVFSSTPCSAAARLISWDPISILTITCTRAYRQGCGLSCSQHTTKLYPAAMIASFLRNVVSYAFSLVTFTFCFFCLQITTSLSSFEAKHCGQP